MIILYIVEEQTQQQSELAKTQEDNSTSQQEQTIRRCTKCKAPMKGHPRGHCPVSPAPSTAP